LSQKLLIIYDPDSGNILVKTQDDMTTVSLKVLDAIQGKVRKQKAYYKVRKTSVSVALANFLCFMY